MSTRRFQPIYRPKSGFVVVVLRRGHHCLEFMCTDGSTKRELTEDVTYALKETAEKVAFGLKRRSMATERSVRVLRVRSCADQKLRAYRIGFANGMLSARNTFRSVVRESLDAIDAALKSEWDDCTKGWKSL